MEQDYIIQIARELRLYSFGYEFEDFLQQALEENWSHTQLIYRLLEREKEIKTENRRKQKIRTAAFSELKYLKDIIREELPKEGQMALPELETLRFVKDRRNVILYGNPGTGKTHISIAIGIKACMEGYSVYFTSVPSLLTRLTECKNDRTLRAFELRFERYDLVICDEFGYVSCNKEGGELLFNLLSLRCGRKSTIITTNLSFDRWGEIIKDKVLVTAMVDRLTHKAKLVNMIGESYRLKETKMLLMSDGE